VVPPSGFIPLTPIWKTRSHTSTTPPLAVCLRKNRQQECLASFWTVFLTRWPNVRQHQNLHRYIQVKRKCQNKSETSNNTKQQCGTEERQSQNITSCCWFWHERANYHLWKLRIIFSTSFYLRRVTSGVLHHPKLQNIFWWHYHLQNHLISFISYCYDAQIKNEKCTSNTTNNNKKCSLKFSRKQPMWQIQLQIRLLFCKGPYRSRVIQFLQNTVKWQASISRAMNR